MAVSTAPPPADPPSSSTTITTTTTATATRPLFPNPPQSTNSRPLTPPPLHHHPPPSHHYHHHQQQQAHPRYAAQPFLSIAPRITASQIHPPVPTNKHHRHDPPPPPQGFLYPVASSGSFLPKPIRPAEPTVTIANPGGYPSRPVVQYPQTHPVRPFGFNHSEQGQGQIVHYIRPTHFQHTLLGSNGGVMPGVVKGVPVSSQPKVALSPTVPDCKGFKDISDRSRDDTFATIRDRKVIISGGASLYALCRSWLRNGFSEESQPQYMDGVRSLPRPLPILVGGAHSPIRKEDDKEEEEETLISFKLNAENIFVLRVWDEVSGEQVSSQELLQRHIKRAKKVRARLREERLQRIARYKTRLALLIPPIVEQQLSNDTSAGN
ncbi:unnamed protein product [Ilex paraguariensis]|uniref:Uncharacterized protein n=1 Tax=Ilex paraguariensis TaxID=185542 RepID=A0ABC8U7U0_9AQUA